jgi:hypothetical protein
MYRFFMRLASVLVFMGFASRPGSPTAILGWWHGTSTCVHAEWNAACNDEEVVYQFVPAPPDSTHSVVHAFKMVQGRLEEMGDIGFTYSPERSAWDGDFKNASVDIRWSFELHGDTLVGQEFQRPEMRVGRHVVATRTEAPTN